MSMSIAEAQTVIKGLFEKADLIDKRYPDGEVTNNEDLVELKRCLTEIDGLEAKLAVLRDAEDRHNYLAAGMERYTRPANAPIHNPHVAEILEGKRVSPGDQFIGSREYRELKMGGAFNSQLNRVEFNIPLKEGTSLMEWKALLRGGSETSGGAFVQNARLPGYLEILQRELSALELIPRTPTESDTVEYIQESTFTNAAAFVAEATGTTGTVGYKPESALAYAAVTAPVKTLAHWIPVTNRMLSDAPAIRGIVNGRLLLGLDLTLETQVFTGDGTGENLTGILNTTGVLIQASGTDSVLDRIFKARTAVRTTGLARPNAVVLNPSDWADIRLARENVATATYGNYLMGPPSQLGAVSVWGLPAVESQAMTENTALVGDFLMGCALFDREQAALRVGTINAQFVMNQQTLLAEMRVAFVVYRPTAFSRVTGV